MAERYFVFGSNLAGIHGKGSALAAVQKHGALRGCGAGPQGSAWGIPTKKHWKSSAMSLEEISPYVWALVEYAKQHPDTLFDVVRVGCGLAGYTDEEMAPLFNGAPSNVLLPERWREIIDEYYRLRRAKGATRALPLRCLLHPNLPRSLRLRR